MRSIARHGVRLLVASATMAALPALTAVTPAHATDECIGNTNNSESGDCVHMEVYTAVDESIVVAYWGNQDYDFYQLRWSRPGRAETQRVVRGEGASGGWWALNNAWHAGAVVLGPVAADELLPDRDLDRVTNDRDLHLATPIGGPDSIVRAGEAHVARPKPPRLRLEAS